MIYKYIQGRYSYEQCNVNVLWSWLFITATCAALEKDRSWTDLSKLIKFRNAFVRMVGAESVAKYYCLGSMIVDSINAEEQPKEMYQNLWNIYIEPSLTSFFERKLEDVKCIYVNMCKMLCEKYDIPVEDHILRKYEVGKLKNSRLNCSFKRETKK